MITIGWAYSYAKFFSDTFAVLCTHTTDSQKQTVGAGRGEFWTIAVQCVMAVWVAAIHVVALLFVQVA